MKKELAIKGINKYDIIILLLLIITIALMFFIMGLMKDLSIMIDLFKEFCYLAPADQLAYNFTGGV